MPTYGLKYVTQFDSVSDVNNVSRTYTLQFLYKEYIGPSISVTGGSTSVVLKCTVDDPFAPIKGQSLDIILDNKNNSLPITVFQSEDDDGIMVKLLDYAGNVLWVGFLVQDDFYELMVDYPHEITLSANDSLGLLKGVILSEAEVRRAFSASFQTNGVNTVVYVNVADTAFYPQAGNPIEFSGVEYVIATAVNENTTISTNDYNWTIALTTATPGFANTVETIYLTGEINLILRNSLLSIIAVCLGNTNIPLLLNIFHTLYEYRQDNARSTFEQTIIDCGMFIQGETFDNCYDVLTKVLTAFRCSLFQANGQWNIIHWDEAFRYTNNNIPGFIYDETFQFLGPTVFDCNFFIGPDPQLTRPITGLTQGSIRGWKFSRKVFNYTSPKNLLKNQDLTILGDLRSSYISLGIQYNEYDASFWEDSESTPYVQRFIRVATDIALQREINRVLVVVGPADVATASRVVRSSPIEVEAGDKMKLSFSVRGSQSFSGAWNLVFLEKNTDGASSTFIDELPVGDEDWGSSGFNFAPGGNTDEWRTIEMNPKVFPFTGLFYVYLTCFTSAVETQYKDIRFEYIPHINDSTKITGHIHKQLQDVNKKLNNDVEIQVDDTPRNSIAGTLFLDTKTNLTQDRTVWWKYFGSAVLKKLGESTTFDELTWKQKTRLTIEGSFIGLNQNNLPISLLSMQITDFYPLKTFTFGLLSIDYKNNRFSGKLWEIYDKADEEITPDYTFTYIYSTT